MIPGLDQWVKDLALPQAEAPTWCCSGCGADLSCSSNSTPSLGTSVCRRCGLKKTKQKNEPEQCKNYLSGSLKVSLHTTSRLDGGVSPSPYPSCSLRQTLDHDTINKQMKSEALKPCDFSAPWLSLIRRSGRTQWQSSGWDIISLNKQANNYQAISLWVSNLRN